MPNVLFVVVDRRTGKTPDAMGTSVLNGQCAAEQAEHADELPQTNARAVTDITPMMGETSQRSRRPSTSDVDEYNRRASIRRWTVTRPLNRAVSVLCATQPRVTAKRLRSSAYTAAIIWLSELSQLDVRRMSIGGQQ